MYADQGRFPDDAATFEIYLGTQLCATRRIPGTASAFTLVGGTDPITVSVDSPEIIIRISSDQSQDGQVDITLDDISVVPVSSCPV